MRISGTYRLRNKPVNGTTQVLGQNRGMSSIAQEAIDNLASVAARKSVEAIATDSWPVYVHRIKPGSKTCSCRKDDDYTNDDNPDFKTKAELNRLGQENLTSAENGFVGDGNFSTSIRLRGFGAKDSYLEGSEGAAKASPDFDDLTKEGGFDSTLDGNYPAEPNTDFSDLISIYPSLGNRCGICGGNGKCDAYEWVSGTKFLLVPDDSVGISGRASIDQSTKPWSVLIDTADKTSYMEWKIHIPAYHIGLDIVRVKSNMDLAPMFILEARNPSQANENASDAWVTFNKAFLTPYLATGIDLRVRVRLRDDVPEMPDTDATFTHAEIWILGNELPRCQFPQIDRDIQGGTAEALIVTEFEIDPGVGKLPRGSLIENPAMGRMFIVTGVLSKETSKRYVFNITGRLTLVSPTDGPYGLAARPKYSGQPSVNWRGAEKSRFSKGLPYSDGTLLERGIPLSRDSVDKS